MDSNTWADEVRGALAQAGKLRQVRTIGAEGALVSVESTLRAILDNPRACDKRGTAAVLRLDIAELADATAWASPDEAWRLRELVARLDVFAVRLGRDGARPIAA